MKYEKEIVMYSDINSYVIEGINTKYVKSEFNHDIVKAQKFIDQVINGTEEFHTEYIKANGTRVKRVSALGKHVENLYSYSQIYSRDYKYSPALEFLFEEMRTHPIKDYISTAMLFENDPEGVTSELFNDFVRTMRAKAVQAQLKKKIADWESKFKKNEKRINWFEPQLFNRCSRLMVVRVDALYHKAVFTPSDMNQIMADDMVRKERDQADYWAGEDISTPRMIEGRIALEEVQKDRQRLFDRMKGKTSLFEHLVGYIWRIEFAKEAGYHLHLMFFFKGSIVEKHEYLAQEIGKYWQDEITEGRGYFENCNRKKTKYGDDWALGQINHWETGKREKLRKAMQYFCKTNQLVQVVPYAGCRLFGCGFVHRQRKAYGGRPRTKRAVGSPENQQLGL